MSQQQRKNLNELSRDELIGVVKQLHVKQQQMMQQHQEDLKQLQIAASSSSSSAGGAKESSSIMQQQVEVKRLQQELITFHQQQEESSLRIKSLQESNSLMKAELIAYKKRVPLLEVEIRTLKEKSEADEETIRALIHQLEEGSATTTTTKIETTKCASGATNANFQRSQMNPSSSPTATSGPNGSNNNNAVVTVAAAAPSCYDMHDVAMMHEAVDTLKRSLITAEENLQVCNAKVVELREENAFLTLLTRRQGVENADKQIGGDDTVWNENGEGGSLPLAPSTNTIVTNNTVSDVSRSALLHELRLEAAAERDEANALRGEVRRLQTLSNELHSALTVVLKKQREHETATATAAAISRDLPQPLASTPHLAAVSNGGGVGDAVITRAQQLPSSGSLQNVSFHTNDSTSLMHHSSGGSPQPGPFSATTAVNPQRVVRQAAVLIHRSGEECSVDDHHSASSSAAETHEKLGGVGSGWSLFGGLRGASKNDLSATQQGQHRAKPSGSTPPPSPSSSLSIIELPAVIAQLPSIHIRGPTPREKKLLERIALVEEYIRCCEAFERTRQKNIDDVEKNRAEMVTAMHREISSQRQEISALKKLCRREEEEEVGKSASMPSALRCGVGFTEGNNSESLQGEMELLRDALRRQREGGDAASLVANAPCCPIATSSVSLPASTASNEEAAIIANVTLAPMTKPQEVESTIIIAFEEESGRLKVLHAELESRLALKEGVLSDVMFKQLEGDRQHRLQIAELQVATENLRHVIQTHEEDRREREERFRSAAKAVQAIKQRDAELQNKVIALESQLECVTKANAAKLAHTVQALSEQLLVVEEAIRVKYSNALNDSHQFALQVEHEAQFWVERCRGSLPRNNGADPPADDDSKVESDIAAFDAHFKRICDERNDVVSERHLSTLPLVQPTDETFEVEDRCGAAVATIAPVRQEAIPVPALTSAVDVPVPTPPPSTDFFSQFFAGADRPPSIASHSASREETLVGRSKPAVVEFDPFA